MPQARTYLIHGLRLRSELPLPEVEAEPGPVDLKVSCADPGPVPAVLPDGEAIVALELPGLEYAIVRDRAGYTARFPSLCEFQIASDLGAVSVRSAPGADPGVVGALLTGNVLAFVLGMAGEVVLHASAVEAAGSAIAIVGAPGAGKSTLAAYVCLAGARLVTDDTLRVGLADSHALCFRGTHRIRLRSGAAELAERFSSESRAATADGRIAIRLTPSEDPRPPLAALVVPKLSPDATAVEVQPLPAREGLTALIANSRLIGWTRSAELRHQLAALAKLAETVPVLEARIPWADSPPPGLAEELLERIRGPEALGAKVARR